MRPIRTLRPQGRALTSTLRTQPTELRAHQAILSINTATPTHSAPSIKHTPKTQTRSFNLSSLASFLPTNGDGNNSPKRVLTASRILPYSPELLFKVISSVESYSQFLPFLNASTVTARDPETGYPTQAFLTVGYGPLSETFTSLVDCDRSKWVVEARSGAKYGKPDAAAAQSGGLSGFFPGASEGIFEYLSTRWELAPLEGKGTPQTKVNLEVQFEFKNQLHATVMGAVEGQMAGVMIEAFEKRMKEMHGQ